MTLHAPDTVVLAQPQNHVEPASGTTPKTSRRTFFAVLRREDSGQDLIEYALAAALIGLASISTMNGLAANIANTVDHISREVSRAIPDSTPPPHHGHDH